MVATTLPFVSLEEYLRCSEYEPDADYVDDHIEERPMGELDHSGLQMWIGMLLNTKANRPHFFCYPELRVQVAARRFRIPDLCLVRAGSPKERFLKTPPLLCIEVLSPEDTMTRTMVRVRDFLKMGVPEVWVVDSESRTIQVCAGATTTLHEQGELSVPQTPVTVTLSEIFSILDR